MAKFYVVEDGKNCVGFTHTPVEAECYCLDYPVLKYFEAWASHPDNLGIPHMSEVNNLEQYREA